MNGKPVTGTLQEELAAFGIVRPLDIIALANPTHGGTASPGKYGPTGGDGSDTMEPKGGATAEPLGLPVTGQGVGPTGTDEIMPPGEKEKKAAAAKEKMGSGKPVAAAKETEEEEEEAHESAGTVGALSVLEAVAEVAGVSVEDLRTIGRKDRNLLGAGRMMESLNGVLATLGDTQKNESAKAFGNIGIISELLAIGFGVYAQKFEAEELLKTAKAFQELAVEAAEIARVIESGEDVDNDALKAEFTEEVEAVLHGLNLYRSVMEEEEEEEEEEEMPAKKMRSAPAAKRVEAKKDDGDEDGDEDDDGDEEEKDHEEPDGDECESVELKGEVAAVLESLKAAFSKPVAKGKKSGKG